MKPENTIGSEIFKRFIDELKKDLKELNFKVWSPTPWMTDVFVSPPERRHEIRNWCNRHYGPESSPINAQDGKWREANVTMKSFCWYGFASEEMMKEFENQFPSSEKV